MNPKVYIGYADNATSGVDAEYADFNSSAPLYFTEEGKAGELQSNDSVGENIYAIESTKHNASITPSDTYPKVISVSFGSSSSNKTLVNNGRLHFINGNLTGVTNTERIFALDTELKIIVELLPSVPLEITPPSKEIPGPTAPGPDPPSFITIYYTEILLVQPQTFYAVSISVDNTSDSGDLILGWSDAATIGVDGKFSDLWLAAPDYFTFGSIGEHILTYNTVNEFEPPPPNLVIPYVEFLGGNIPVAATIFSSSSPKDFYINTGPTFHSVTIDLGSKIFYTPGISPVESYITDVSIIHANGTSTGLSTDDTVIVDPLPHVGGYYDGTYYIRVIIN